MTLLRTFLAVAATVAVAFAAVVASVTAPDADAAGTTCAGNLILTKPIKHGKRKIGELNVYWDAATKKNCVVTMHAGPTWDKKRLTSVELWRCKKGTKAGEFCDREKIVSDQGKYRFQAGPVRLKAGGRCIFARGWINWRGENIVVSRGSTDGEGDQRAGFCN